VGVGFGIKDAEQVKNISKFSDAIVIGSSIVNKIKDFEKSLLGFADSEYSDFMSSIEKSGDYSDDIANTLKEMLEKFVSTQTW
jgi:tryptophan synthase alpha subunit